MSRNKQSEPTVTDQGTTFATRFKRIFGKKEENKASAPSQRTEQLFPLKVLSQAEVNSLLEHYQKGDYFTAKVLATSITQRFPDHQFSWKVLGALLQQTGELSESVIANQEAVKLDPKDAEAYSNLGVALQELGRLDAAEASHRKAISLEPSLVTAHYNLGITLKKLGRLEDAEVSNRNAIALAPDIADAHNNLGSTLQELGRLQDAEASYKKAIALQPTLAEAHNNLGSALQELGRLQDALTSYKKATALKPDYAEAHNNLGSALQELGRLQDAEASYREAIALKPDLAQAHYNLGNTLLENNEATAALEVAIRSIEITPTIEAKVLFIESAKRITPEYWNLSLSKMVSAALLEPWGRPSDLVQFACRLLKTNAEFSEVLNRSTSEPDQVQSADVVFSSSLRSSSDFSQLLYSTLSSSHIADADMEVFCTGLRKHLLKIATSDKTEEKEISALSVLHCSLAQQCFINEYVYFQTSEEIKDSEYLRNRLASILESGQVAPAVLVIAVACYFPLYSISRADKLLQHTWSAEVRAVLEQQIQEHLRELRLRTSIPCLTSIEDQVSLAVQTQYEENPYPRWVHLPRESNKKLLDSYIKSKFPTAKFQRLTDVKDPEILVAGCGTGQHPIGTSQSIKNAKILAIDLSMASLAYAKRKTIELGIDSIEYAQADLLKLADLGRTFDVIESSGVLHHLDNPIEGLQVLLGLLRPQGFMRLGFYSALARRDIVKVRNLISQNSIGSSSPDIRTHRKNLFELKNFADFGFAMSSIDFFSTSACRDLLFHVQEHRMNLGTLAKFLIDHDLNFVGFEIDRSVIQAYKQRFQNDPSATNLNNWQIYEEENPNTFVGMYQFWIQKN